MDSNFDADENQDYGDEDDENAPAHTQDNPSLVPQKLPLETIMEENSVLKQQQATVAG